MTRSPVAQGVLRALVLAPGIVPLGMLFGASAAAQGFSVVSAAAFSLGVLAGATQFAVLAAAEAGAALLALLGVVVLLQARYLLLSAATLDLARRAGMPRAQRVLLAFGVVEESYALQASWARLGPVPVAGLLAVPATLMTIWTGSTILGALIGDRLPPLEPYGLDYALPGIFIGLFGIFADDRRKLAAGLIALVLGAVLALAGLTIVAALLVPPVIAYIFGRTRPTDADAVGLTPEPPEAPR